MLGKGNQLKSSGTNGQRPKINGVHQNPKHKSILACFFAFVSQGFSFGGQHFSGTTELIVFKDIEGQLKLF